MNTIVTSKEEILQTSRELIRQQGWSAVSIRSVAAACGVSVGSIYNYFDSKADLVGATVESVWSEIFHRPNDMSVFQSVESCITWMYGRVAYGSEQYPGFFTLHSLGFMLAFSSVWLGCFVMTQDQKIRSDAFTEDFTEEKLASVLFSLMLSALLRQDYDPSTVLEMVRRLIY